MDGFDLKQSAFTDYIIGKVLEELERRGLTQKDLARIMTKSEAEVSRWLSGKSNFTIATLAKISVALGVDILPVKMKNVPYNIEETPISRVADSELSYGVDMNAMKLQLMSSIMNLNNVHEIQRVSSFLQSLHSSGNVSTDISSWDSYNLSPEIQALSADRRLDSVEYKTLITEEVERRHR